MFNRLKPEGCLCSKTNRWTYSSLFNVQKNDVWVFSMDDLVNLVKAIWVGFSMPVCSKPKFRFSSSIMNIWTHTYKYLVRLMFEKWCLGSFDVRKNGVWPIITTFYVKSILAKVVTLTSANTIEKPVNNCLFFGWFFSKEVTCKHSSRCIKQGRKALIR